ncbi:hypothetical protein [Sporosarcina sp. YIM B06819]|uniref:hypothetical protein n=1 Tax=Sporosarcina sp. YIM B06819 TaxID=3081769 RepID=UPI00298D28EB|nr:hypothetical protein [Sporosarcina sp. YIM B06819]
MTDNKWDDSKIDNLLGSMPDIRDERLKSDILMRLQQDERLHHPRRNNVKKWMPALVAVAALLMFSLVIPSMLQHNDSAMDKAIEPASMKMKQSETSMDSEEQADVATADAGASAETFNIATARMLPENHVLLQEELQGFQLLQMRLDVDANTVVPMTFLIPKEQIAADFPEGEPDSAALFRQYAADTPEAELGFVEMEPVASNSPQPYYKTVMPSGQLYLTPYETGDALTAEEALLAMKEAQSDVVEALIPENITYAIQEREGVVIITFTEPLDLSAMDQSAANEMIEGFMLTANNFKKRVQLENVMQNTFLRYDLTTVLPEPVGVNPTYFFE